MRASQVPRLALRTFAHLLLIQDYIGQLSIDSVPRVTNVPYLVVLSIAVAIGAVSLGLYLLFVVLRPKLEHRWYKRCGIAALLALAIDLMHWGA